MNRYAHRIGWMLLAFAVHSLYFPVNRSVQPTVLLKTPLDGFIPLWPVWVVPYVLTWAIWLACAVWVVWKMEPRLYKAAIVALFAAACIGLMWFLAFPTYTERPLLTAGDWPAQLLRAVHEADRAANAFPSLHITITSLIAASGPQRRRSRSSARCRGWPRIKSALAPSRCNHPEARLRAPASLRMRASATPRGIHGRQRDQANRHESHGEEALWHRAGAHRPDRGATHCEPHGTVRGRVQSLQPGGPGRAG